MTTDDTISSADDPAQRGGSGAAHHHIVDGVDVDAVHGTVLACPHVADLGSGLLGAAATYLPGRRLEGVRITDDAIELEVRMTWGPSAADVAAEIRAAVVPLAEGRRVDVAITDILVPEVS